MPSASSGIGLSPLRSDGDGCEWSGGGPKALKELTRDAVVGCPEIAERLGTFVFDGEFRKPPDGGSTALDESAIDSASGSPGTAEYKGILVFDGDFWERSDG